MIEPWAHGTVVRATAYPATTTSTSCGSRTTPAWDVDALVAVADDALAGLEHRRVDFDRADVADSLRAGFLDRGWKAMRLVWMRHETPPPPGPQITVQEVPYDAVHPLRVAWHGEDFPGQDSSSYHLQAREVALRRHVRVLAVYEGQAPVAFAQLEHDGDAAEITQVFVHPDHRGGGRGTAMTRAAIEAAGDVRDLWIVADDEDRPKELYARLGFRPAWATMEFTRWPGS